MPIIESCRLMPWTREETQSSSTKEEENGKFKTASSGYSASSPSEQGCGSGWISIYSGRGKFMTLPLKSKLLETPGSLVTDDSKMFPL